MSDVAKVKSISLVLMLNSILVSSAIDRIALAEKLAKQTNPKDVVSVLKENGFKWDQPLMQEAIAKAVLSA